MGVGIERGFRGVVGDRLEVRDGAVGIGVQGERAEDAGEIDYSAGVALFDKREQLAGERNDRLEVVGVENIAQIFIGGLACSQGQSQWTNRCPERC